MKINIAEILKDCPIGTKLYSPLCGECTLHEVVKDKIFIRTCSNERVVVFDEYGRYFNDSECLILPSKENRDWSTFKVNKPKFDPKTLQEFDKVLARIDSSNAYYWFADFVSAPANEKYDMPCIMSDEGVKMIIPYNEETEHLIGTEDDAPEFYRYWEE